MAAAQPPQLTGVTLATALLGAVIAATCASLVSITGITIVSVPAFAFAALPAVTTARTVRSLGARGRVYAALLPTIFVPVLAAAAALTLAGTSLLHGSSSSATHNGVFWLAVAVMAIPIAAPIMFTCWGIVEHAVFERALCRTAPWVVTGAAVSAVLATVAQISRASLDDWPTRLPIVAEVSQDRFVEIPKHTFELVPSHSSSRADAAPAYLLRATTAHGDLFLRCGWLSTPNCDLFFLAPGTARPSGSMHWGRHADYRIRLDQRHGLYLIEPRWNAWPGAFTQAGEYLPRVGVARVHSSLAPPIVWTVCALFGAALAAAMLHAGHRRRWAREGAVWTEGRVEGSVIVLDDGTRLPAGDFNPDEEVVARGIVVATPTFRSDAPSSAEVVLPGRIDDRRRDARIDETRTAAWAIGVALLAVTPVIVFALFGFFP